MGGRVSVHAECTDREFEKEQEAKKQAACRWGDAPKPWATTVAVKKGGQPPQRRNSMSTKSLRVGISTKMKVKDRPEPMEEHMEIKELNVIDVQAIEDCHCDGLKAPQFQWHGRCPKRVPDHLMDEWAEFKQDCKDGLPRNFYLFVLRDGIVKAIAIERDEALVIAEGPYIGFRIIVWTPHEEYCRSEGEFEVGEEIGGTTGLFLHESPSVAALRDALCCAAIEGTDTYDYYVEDGVVRSEAERTGMI